MAVDGGSGEAEVKLPAKDIDILKAMAERTMSDPSTPPSIRRPAPSWAWAVMEAARMERFLQNA
jgi:hypothetical protein